MRRVLGSVVRLGNGLLQYGRSSRESGTSIRPAKGMFFSFLYTAPYARVVDFEKRLGKTVLQYS